MHRRSLLSLAAAIVVLGGCGSSITVTGGPVQGPAATSSSTTTTTLPVATTAALPSAPAPSASEAAARLMSDWGAGDRSAAATIASPAAVATLFALSYPSGYLQFRSCSTNPPPAPDTCTYRNTASDTGQIYEVNVAEDPAGWYVESVLNET